MPKLTLTAFRSWSALTLVTLTVLVEVKLGLKSRVMFPTVEVTVFETETLVSPLPPAPMSAKAGALSDRPTTAVAARSIFLFIVHSHSFGASARPGTRSGRQPLFRPLDRRPNER